MLISSNKQRLWMAVVLLVFGVAWTRGIFTFSAHAQSHAQQTSSVEVGSIPNADSGQPQKRVAIDIPTMHKQPFFWTVMVASLMGWVLGMVKGFDSSKDWIAKYWNVVPKPFLFGTDLLIFVIIGAYVGTGLYQPATFTAALGAGLSWPVALGALASKATDSSGLPKPQPVPPNNPNGGGV